MSRSRLAGSRGFMLIELLVMVMIVGILAAIALALFLNQRGKAQDAEAKSMVATAATVLEDWSTEHDGDGYGGATPAKLVALEPGLSRARGLSVRGDAKSYTVSVDSAGDGGTFLMNRLAGGQILRDCTHPGDGSCGDRLDAHGNRW